MPLARRIFLSPTSEMPNFAAKSRIGADQANMISSVRETCIGFAYRQFIGGP